MSNFSVKEKVNLHFVFLFIISLYYLIPYFFVGQLILKPHDLLDSEIVYNHIIGKIYKGDFESISLFISGEMEWYFLRRILQPLTLLYALFETETAFWITDIFIKLICYICFFKLSRKLNCSPFHAAILGCLYACSIDAWTHFGLGIATFPYLIYLVIKNKNLSLRHYFLLSFIGLNTDLVGDVLIIPLLFLITLIFCEKFKNYNFKLFFKISFTLIFFIILSNLNVIYSVLFAGPFHRSEYIYEGYDLITNFKNLLKNFFYIPDSNFSYFFHKIPFTLFIFPTVLISLFSKNKTTYLILLVIFFMVFVEFLLNLEFVVDLRNNIGGVEGSLFKSIHWGYMMHLLPALYGLLFITILSSPIIKKTRYLVYSLIFLSLLTTQIRISIVPLGKHLLSFDSLNIEQKNRLRESFHSQKFIAIFKDIMKFKRNTKTTSNQIFKSKYTFAGYYDYENYKYIKNIVLDSRTVSIGLDPMVAVMNNIKVIDGYHNLYPLSYKKKFRKVIEKQLETSEAVKKYYDFTGSRIYTFVENESLIKTNFSQARRLGAEYVISKYSIANKILIPICEKCNNSEIFLYKIKI